MIEEGEFVLQSLWEKRWDWAAFPLFFPTSCLQHRHSHRRRPSVSQCVTLLFARSRQVEVKPYVLDDQMCDECQGARCGGKFAPFFCANVTCLQYYCEYCWASIHSRAGREFHKPLVKEGGDRPRHVSFRWS